MLNNVKFFCLHNTLCVPFSKINWENNKNHNCYFQFFPLAFQLLIFDELQGFEVGNSPCFTLILNSDLSQGCAWPLKDITITSSHKQQVGKNVKITLNLPMV